MRIATLGPAGSNHEKAARAYLRFHGLADAELSYFETYSQALEMLRGGSIDFFTQVCAHPEVAITIERFHREVFVVDSFVSPTRPMDVVTRRDVKEPKSLGYMIASAATYARGTIYMGLAQADSLITGGLLVAMDANTGRIKWVFRAIPQGPEDDGWERLP